MDSPVIVTAMATREPIILTKDHVIPISRGGSDAIDNIVGACLTCNKRKHRKTGDEFFEVLDDAKG